jgi:formylglycine-generating enzyme required for sulfatase activity
MHGNVFQWVEDCLHNTYEGAPQDGSVWPNGDCSRRVVRGGSWNLNPQYLRSALRFRFSTDARINYLGFRVGRTL